MTTPVSFQMPWAEAYRPKANGYQIADVALTPGVSLLRFTWDGAEGIRISIERTVNGATKSTPWQTVIQPAAQGTRRTSMITEIAVKDATSVRVQSLAPVSQETVDSGATLGVTVFPTPPK